MQYRPLSQAGEPPPKSTPAPAPVVDPPPGPDDPEPDDSDDPDAEPDDAEKVAANGIRWNARARGRFAA